MAYTIARHPWPTRPQLAVAPTRRTVDAAVADMGDGAVFDAGGRLVALHERHLPVLERREADAGATRGD